MLNKRVAAFERRNKEGRKMEGKKGISIAIVVAVGGRKRLLICCR